MYEKIVVVTRQTRMQELVARFNTRAQACFYLKHSGADFDDYVSEDDAYRAAIETAGRHLDVGLPLQFIDRRFVPNYVFSEKDLVVAIGQDGLVANVAKYAAGKPLIGVNPDPRRFDGVLVPTQLHMLRGAVENVISGNAVLSSVTLAEVRLNDGQRLLAFNDFFLGARTHISASYAIKHKDRREIQSSSGVIVSTGAGSTGWLSSLFNMASGINTFLGGQAVQAIKMDWTCRDLVFVVREPFASRHSQIGLVGGLLHEGEALEIESRMPSAGIIFSDGIESDFLMFNSGSIAQIRTAPERALLFEPSSLQQAGAKTKTKTFAFATK